MAAWLAGCCVAFFRGRGTARLIAGAFLLDFAWQPLTGFLVDRYAMQYTFLLGDVLVLAIAAWALHRQPERWIAAVVAFQLLSIGTHIAKGIDVTIRGWGYATLAWVWGFASLGALLLGVLRSRTTNV